jgi:Na+(H+)/acetate symporter ActP
MRLSVGFIVVAGSLTYLFIDGIYSSRLHRGGLSGGITGLLTTVGFWFVNYLMRGNFMADFAGPVLYSFISVFPIGLAFVAYGILFGIFFETSKCFIGNTLSQAGFTRS